ncbi:MAG TPA: helix-turn-helix domain-containing protein [Dehalococcoidia bacterium]|nr:helix-turn-helix domain-containing protein [Dehalococcoidia bacterium]
MDSKLKLIAASEAAHRLGVHHKTVSRLMRLGKLGAVKVANRWLLEESALERFAKTYEGKKGRPKGYSPKKEGRK